jgi:protein-L-isoaspartate(D-aspartate) O-methyltransferase
VIGTVTTISRGRQVATAISVFTVEPHHQRRLADLLVRTTEEVISRLPGFLSASIHKSLDGTRVITSAQWQSREALEAMMAQAETIPQMREVAGLASVDVHVCAGSSTHRSANALRGEMVDSLVSRVYRSLGEVESAFRSVPRHLFVPGVSLETAYSQEAIITHRGPNALPTSSSSMPSIMALMLEQLGVQPGHRVLEIGAGTGYNAALLAVLAGPDGEVTTIDLDETIAREAREHLDAAGYTGVRTVSGDGWSGVPEHAPYDRTEVTVGISDLSPAWIAQLKDGGRLVVPLWLARGQQLSIAFEKAADRLRSVAVTECGFMRLRGPHAGPETYLSAHGWLICLDEPDPACAAALESLLGREPRIEPAPPVPWLWRPRLLLEERRAVLLSRREGTWEQVAHGILDVAASSLAFLTARTWDHRLYTFGSDAARHALVGWLASARSLNVQDLVIEAWPATAPPPHDAIVIRRPNFQFAVRERAQ